MEQQRVTLSRRKDLVVTLGGIAEMQWQEARSLRPINPRVRQYLSDVLYLARLNDIGRERDVIAMIEGVMDATLTVCSRTYGTATVLYLWQPGFITIFWMAGLFRDPLEAGERAFS
jgi:hypothetical protein